MRQSPFTLRINGVDARTLGYGRVTVTELAHLYSSTGGGLHYVKFSLALPRGYSHPALIEGAEVEVLRCGVSLGFADMADPSRDDWTFTADGRFRRAEHFNAEGPTNSPADVVAAANARTLSLGWNGTGNLPDTPIPTDDNTRLPTVQAVLDEYCRLENKRWGLAFDNTPYITDDPVEPSIALRPGTPVMPTASDKDLSRIVVRFVLEEGPEGEPPVYDEVEASNPNAESAREGYEDLSRLGLIDPTDAQRYANALIAANIATRGFTAGMEVGPSKLTNRGGVPIDHWAAPLFALGQLALQHNVLETDGRQAYGQTRNWVVGSTNWQPDRGLVLNPTDLLARSVPQFEASRVTQLARIKAGLAPL